MVYCPPRPTQAPRPAPSPGPGPDSPFPRPGPSLEPGRPSLDPGPGPAAPPPRDPQPGAPAAQPKPARRPSWPRRSHHRIRVIVSAALTAAIALGLAGPSTWQPARHPLPRPALDQGPVVIPRDVISLARQHQRRRRLKIVGTGAAIGTAIAQQTLGSGPNRRQGPGHQPGSSKPPGKGDLRGINVLGWGCPSPSPAALDGTHLWLACQGSILELNASAGVFVAELPEARYGISPDSLSGLAVSGTHLWVASYDDNFVIEIDAATGALVKKLQGPRYGFNGPTVAASNGTYLWVVNDGGQFHGSVTEIDAATGAPLTVLQGPRYGFNGPSAIAVDGTHLWVANNDSDSVTEFPA